MVKELLKKLGVEVSDETTDEEAEQLLTEHIDNLITERDSLSHDKEELSASVEGLQSTQENLSKELSETKTELASTKGKLEQVTEMYKEQFNQNPDNQDEPKDDKKLGDDVLQQILDSK